MGNLHVSFIFFQTFSSLSKIRGGKREYNKEKEEGREGKKEGGRKEEEEEEREREKRKCFHQVKVPADSFSFGGGN